jgi:hypothetical protein
MYRLTRADGTAVERVDKHPFCMSRVFYDPKEKPDEVGLPVWQTFAGVMALRQ